MRSKASASVLLIGALACSGRQSPSAQGGALGQGASQVVEMQALTRACTPLGAEQCFNARDDNCNGIIDESCGLSTGLIQFVISWDKPSADVDLNVIDPNGELAEIGHETRSGLVKERDCPGRHNECRGHNLENVFLAPDKDLPRGRFRVQVRLENLGDEEPPVRVALGARLGSKSYAAELLLHEREEEHDFVFEP